MCPLHPERARLAEGSTRCSAAMENFAPARSKWGKKSNTRAPTNPSGAIVHAAGLALRKLFIPQMPSVTVPTHEFNLPSCGLSIDICSRDKFQVRPANQSLGIPETVCHALCGLARRFGGNMAVESQQVWNFGLDAYSKVCASLQAAPFARCRVEAPPAWIVQTMLQVHASAAQTGEEAWESLKEYMSRLSSNTESACQLLPFQQEGICFGLSRKGRCLLADDMGLGKTLQALTVIAQYQKEWPALVVTPATLRLVWREQAFQWLPHLLPGHWCVQVIMHGRQQVDPQAQLVIVSYELLAKHPDVRHVTSRSCRLAQMARHSRLSLLTSLNT